MDSNKLINFGTYPISGTEITIGSLDLNPYSTVVIQTKDLKLLQTDLGITIDIPYSVLCKIETIEINGIKFKKENFYD